MILTLETYFMHRSRTIEGKDGNPMKEARMLCNSIRQSDSIMTAESPIKYTPGNSVLQYKMGDEIRLNEADFLLLSGAYFA